MCELKRCLIYFLLSATFYIEVRMESSQPKCECGLGNQEDISFRVFQGKKAYAHAYPWVVYILYPTNDTYCGGAILSDLYIITSARCLAGRNTTDVQIVIGAHDTIAQDGTKIPAKSFLIHEGFKDKDEITSNDIALIKVDPLTFSPVVQPICLPHPLSNFTMQSVVIAGWGTSDGKALSRYLLNANRRIQGDTACLDSEDVGKRYHPKENMCAFGTENSACEGDLGSPIMYEVEPYVYQLVGIVSWGKGCVSKKSPAIYMKVTSYLTWIVENTYDSNFCKVNS